MRLTHFSCGLILCCAVHGQWTRTIQTTEAQSAGYDVVEFHDSSLFVLVTNGAYDDEDVHTTVRRFGPAGNGISQLETTPSGYSTSATQIFWEPISERILSFGFVYDTTQPNGAFRGRTLIAEMDPTLDPQSLHYTDIGPPCRTAAPDAGYVATDGTVVLGHSNYQDIDSNFQFWATRFQPGFGVLDSALLIDVDGVGRVQSLVPNGTGSWAIFFNPIADCTVSPSAIVGLDAGLNIVECQPLPIIGYGPFGALKEYRDHISMILLPTGERVICGMYREDWDNDLHGTAIQKLDPNGAVLAQETFYADSDWVAPGIVRGLALASNGDVLIGIVKGYQGGSGFPIGNKPSSIRTIRLDHDLNVLGSALFSGLADSLYYNLNSIAPTQDNGVLLAGSVYDFQENDPKAKAWIAKIGPEQFTAIPERAMKPLSLFPNPGTTGFTLNLDNPVQNAKLTVTDATGKIVLDKSVSGSMVDVGAESLSLGIYAVRLVDHDGRISTTRWVKQ